MLYMVTFTINIPQMLAYIPYMDPMGNIYIYIYTYLYSMVSFVGFIQKMRVSFWSHPNFRGI